MPARKTLLLLLLPLAFAVSATAQARSQAEDRHAHPVRAERERDVDILHYRIELGIDHPNKAFAGRTAVTFNPFHDIDTLRLDAETFTVTRVLTPRGIQLPFVHEDGTLSIALGNITGASLSTSVGYGDTTTVIIEYNAVDYDVDGARFGMANRPDLGLDFREATESNPALVNSLSFPTGARHWYPSHDHPAERATQELFATVQKDWKVLSNGNLIDVIESDSTVTYYWKQDLTHPTYLSAVIAGPFEVIEDALDDLPINYWVYPKDVEDARRSFGRTPEIIRFFEETYGVPFPWDKYDQITVPGIGGGAESTSASLIGEATIHDARADIDYSSHWLVAHEAAHQWWGNLISYRDWTHTWIAESFGSYSEVLWAEHDLGTDNGIVNLLGKRDQYLGQAKNEFIRPIVYDRWRFPNNNFDRHTYQKGANVLHMLRDILGDEAFLRTHQYFLSRYAYEAVSTSDFTESVKRATGRNMDWFFDQWLFRPGHPVIEASHGLIADGSRVTLTLTQKQDFDAGVPVYQLPIEVEIIDASGLRREQIRLTEKEQTFSFALAGPDPVVIVNPDRTVLMELDHKKSQASLRAQLLAPSMGGRLEAAENLDSEDGESSTALAAAMKGDMFWKIRQAAARQLSRMSGSPPRGLVEQFSDLARTDPDSRVRAAAIRGLGRQGSSQQAQTLREMWDSDPSYLVQGSILEALGDIGRKADESFVRSALQMKSPRNVLSNAAKRALEKYEEG